MKSLLLAVSLLTLAAPAFADEYNGEPRRLTQEEMQRAFNPTPKQEREMEAEFARRTGITGHEHFFVAPSSAGPGVAFNSRYRLRMIPRRGGVRGELPSTGGVGYKGNSEYEFRIERRSDSETEGPYQEASLIRDDGNVDRPAPAPQELDGSL